MSYHRTGRVGPEKVSELGEVHGHLLFFLLNTLAPASSYSIPILPWKPLLPDLGSFSLGKADPPLLN